MCKKLCARKPDNFYYNSLYSLSFVQNCWSMTPNLTNDPPMGLANSLKNN